MFYIRYYGHKYNRGRRREVSHSVHVVPLHKQWEYVESTRKKIKDYDPLTCRSCLDKHRWWYLVWSVWKIVYFEDSKRWRIDEHVFWYGQKVLLRVIKFLEEKKFWMSNFTTYIYYFKLSYYSSYIFVCWFCALNVQWNLI
jgi:hypothetical protein